MTSPYCDKYFTKSKEVAKTAGLNPIVKYRVFTRFDGLAALEPMRDLILNLSESSLVNIDVLPTGTPFEAGDTIAIVEGPFQDLVELETLWLQYAALPCYCAKKSKEIVEVARNKMLMDFAARHLFSPISTALASYGAEVGGIPACSTDIGANSRKFLQRENSKMRMHLKELNQPQMSSITLEEGLYPKPGIGTTPHALLAIFHGDYKAMAKAYIKTYPNDNFVALIDYNNREIDDTLLLLKEFGKQLKGIRIDTCGENYAQTKATDGNPPVHAPSPGVTTYSAIALRTALKENNGEHVKIFLSSGFNKEKTRTFMGLCPNSFDGIGTGSFIPKVPTATADIFEVNGENESKVGREWGHKRNQEFYKIIGK